jgi:hypothetical protein
MTIASATVEELLAQVAGLMPKHIGEIHTLWVPDALTFRAMPVPQDVAMAIILDALLGKGLFPAGFDAERGGRKYRYRFEGDKSAGQPS